MGASDTARLLVELAMQDRNFRSSIGAAERELGGLERTSSSLGKKIGSDISAGAGKAYANIKKIGVAAGAAFIGIGVASGKMAADFEANMANVGTLLGKDGSDRVKELGADVKAMSVETGKSLDDLAGGLYQVVSAFGDTADSSKILEISAKASSAGLATTTDAVNLLSSVTKGYGDTSAATVSKVSDLAFQTVKLGQTTFPELAASMGQAVPLASTLKISMEELFGAEATLTGVTGNTAEVNTQLKATFQALIQQNPAMLDGLKKAGFANSEAALKSLGFKGTLDALAESTGGNTQQLQKMFGSAEALNAVLALTGTQSDNFTEKTKAMGDALGQTDEAFKIQQATVSATFARVKAGAAVLAVDLGEKLLPVFLRVEQRLEKVFASPEFQAGAEKLGDAMAGIANEAIDFAERIDWGAVSGAFTIMGKGAKLAIDAFLNAPGWLQAAVVSGWGLNKLTGGALGKITLDLAKPALSGIFGNLFKRGNSPATPMFVADVAGGLGGGGGALGTAGKVGGLLGLLRTSLPGLGGLGSLLGKVPVAGGVLSAIPTLGGVAAIGGGALLGSGIYQALGLNKGLLAAKSSEQGTFQQSLVNNGGDLGKLQGSLDAINAQLNTSDSSAQVALIASRIPFIGDALGNVAPELEKQRDEVIAAIRRPEGEDPRRPTSRRAARAPASGPRPRRRMSRLGVTSLAGNYTAQQTRDAVTRQNPELASIASSSAVTSRKNFSPTFNANISVTSIVSISEVQRKIQSQQIAIGHGLQEGY